MYVYYLREDNKNANERVAVFVGKNKVYVLHDSR